MARAAAVVLADIETREGLGRVVNALETAKELKESGDEVALIFDGAGTRWIGELERPDHRYHRLYEAVGEVIAGACAYCAAAYGVKDAVEAAGVPLLEEFDRHPSLRKYLEAGFQVVTFLTPLTHRTSSTGRAAHLATRSPRSRLIASRRPDRRLLRMTSKSASYSSAALSRASTTR